MTRPWGNQSLLCSLLLAIVALSCPALASAADTSNSFLAETPISAGGGHTCAVTDAGAGTCWGLDTAGQADAPPGELLAVAAGGAHTCAIRADGALDCWGSNAAGQLDNVPSGEFVDVSAGGTHTCAIRAAGTLACWGSNAAGQLDNVPSGEFVDVSAGGTHTCAIRAAGTLACWGSNAAGQLNGIPTGQFVAVAAGGTHTCAIRAAGTLACWGSNAAGQLTGIPTGTFRSVAAGDAHTCAISGAGALTCWGSNSGGQLTGIPTGTFRSVAAGGTHTCAIATDGTTRCWGQDQPGQPTAAPSTAALGRPPLSAAGDYNCMLRPDGTPICWGAPPAQTPAGAELAVSGQLSRACAVAADGQAECWPDSNGAVLPAFALKAIASTWNASCAIGLDGVLSCWGSLASPPSGTFKAVSGGAGYACGIRTDGTLACWGPGGFRTLVGIPSGTFRAVATGNDRACGLRTDGTLACWGSNELGYVEPVPNGTVRAVAAASYGMCAILTDGQQSCWEDGGTVEAPAGTFYSLAAGDNHVCGVRTGGTLSCIGHNDAGQTRPQVLELNLPRATVGDPYSQRLETAPSEPAPEFEAQGDIPDGLAISPDGTLAGTPTKSGDFTFSVTVRNGVGDPSKEEATMEVIGRPVPAVNPAENVGFASADLSGTVDPGDLAAEAWFEYWPASAPSSTALRTPVQQISRGGALVPVAASVTGLSPATDYLFRLSASNELTSAEAAHSSTLPMSSTLSPPTDGQNFNIETVDGKVETKCPDDSGFSGLVRAEQVPVGCLIDTTRGTVRITASKGNGDYQSAHFWGGIFRVGQKAGVNRVASMKLVGQLRCEKRGGKGGRIQMRRHGGGRKLWGSGKGNYKTVGSHGAATVRGTIWLVQDRCDGSTLIKVKSGTVWVNDFVKGIKVVLQAGESYVIEPPTPRLGK